MSTRPPVFNMAARKTWIAARQPEPAWAVLASVREVGPQAAQRPVPAGHWDPLGLGAAGASRA